MRAQQAGSVASGNVAGITVETLVLKTSRRVSRTAFHYDYEVTVRNDGAAQDEVFVQLVGTGAGTTIADAESLVGPMAAGSTATPADRVTIRHDRTQPFQGTQLQWKIDRTAGRITGVAARGQAAFGGFVQVLDANGSNACAQHILETNDSGGYSCRVQANAVTPFVAFWTERYKRMRPMASAATTVPGPGNSSTLNISPLTTAIVSQLAPNRTTQEVLDDPGLISPAGLDAVTFNVRAQISQILNSIGLGAGYNFFTTEIIAATTSQPGNAADQLLDIVKVQNANGGWWITTIDRSQPWIPLADAGAGPWDVLPPPAQEALNAPEATRQVTAKLENCLRTPNRVTSVDDSIPQSQGGRKVTGVVPECQNIFADNYLQSGYLWGQKFYDLLTDADAQNTKIVYEILDTEPGSAPGQSFHRVRIRGLGPDQIRIHSDEYLEGQLSSGQVEVKYVGNQAPLDVTVRPFFRRFEQFSTLPLVQQSTFFSGIQVNVNRVGPNSNDLRACRVFGTGLPFAGVVLAQTTGSNSLTIRRADGQTDPAFTTPAANAGSFFYLQQTGGLSGTPAETPIANPNTLVFAQPEQFGFPPGTSSGDFVPWEDLLDVGEYNIECFYGNNSAPGNTFVVVRSDSIERATALHHRPWPDLLPQSRRYLNPADPLGSQPQSEVVLSWNQPILGNPVEVASFSAFGGGPPVANVLEVPPGAQSILISAPAGQEFYGLDGSASRRRVFQIGLRPFFDRSYLDQIWSDN